VRLSEEWWVSIVSDGNNPIAPLRFHPRARQPSSFFLLPSTTIGSNFGSKQAAGKTGFEQQIAPQPHESMIP